MEKKYLQQETCSLFTCVIIILLFFVFQFLWINNISQYQKHENDRTMEQIINFKMEEAHVQIENTHYYKFDNYLYTFISSCHTANDAQVLASHSKIVLSNGHSVPGFFFFLFFFLFAFKKKFFLVGSLVTIKNAQQNQILRNLLLWYSRTINKLPVCWTDQKMIRVWLGASFIENTWKWQEFNNLTTTILPHHSPYFLHAEPNHQNNNENCLVLEGRYKVYYDVRYRRFSDGDYYPLNVSYSRDVFGWNDLDCTSLAPYFIQYPLVY